MDAEWELVMGRASCRLQGDKQHSVLAASSCQSCQISPGRQRTLGGVSMLREHQQGLTV